MSSTRRRRIRATHNRELAARDAHRRRDAAVHEASKHHGDVALTQLIAWIALLLLFAMVVAVLLA
jgi:hypothetical protein